MLNLVCYLLVFTEGSNVTQNPHNVMKTIQNMNNVTRLVIRRSAECKCKQSLNKYDKGNCTTESLKFGGRKWCYVIQPSNCTDLKNSTFHEEKGIPQKYSAEACPHGKCILICHIDYNLIKIITFFGFWSINTSIFI